MRQDSETAIGPSAYLAYPAIRRSGDDAQFFNKENRFGEKSSHRPFYKTRLTAINIGVGDWGYRWFLGAIGGLLRRFSSARRSRNSMLSFSRRDSCLFSSDTTASSSSFWVSSPDLVSISWTKGKRGVTARLQLCSDIPGLVTTDAKRIQDLGEFAWRR